MKDRYAVSALVGREIVECERLVRPGSRVRLKGEWYVGRCLGGRVGEKVTLRVSDAWALEYSVFADGKNIGSVRYQSKPS